MSASLRSVSDKECNKRLTDGEKCQSAPLTHTHIRTHWMDEGMITDRP